MTAMTCHIGTPLKADYDREYQAARQGDVSRRAMLARASRRWQQHVNACPVCREDQAMNLSNNLNS